MTICVASTLAPYKATAATTHESLGWISNLDRLVHDANRLDENINVFAALEVDDRGIAVYDTLLAKLEDSGVPFDTWTFTLDDHAEEITSDNRLHRICTGRNHISEYATRHGDDWILFLDSDTTPNDETVTKLLALHWAICGGEIPEYCLTGPEVSSRPTSPPSTAFEQCECDYEFPVEMHWNTAGYLLVHREIFTRARWGRDPDHIITDDPWFQFRVVESTGWNTLVRKDCRGSHVSLVPMEARGHDRRIRRMTSGQATTTSSR